MLILGRRSIPILKKEKMPSNAMAMKITVTVIGRRILVVIKDTSLIYSYSKLLNFIFSNIEIKPHKKMNFLQYYMEMENHHK